MEFIRKMKKREFIEMGLKTLAAVFAAFIAVILMESMIYGIQLNALKNGTTHTTNSDSTIAYCIKDENDKYFVLYFNEENDPQWCATKSQLKTKEECEQMEGFTVKEVVMRAPTAFELTITPTHYIVISVFMSLVVGFFVYKFVKLSKLYKNIETKFKETGVIELG